MPSDVLIKQTLATAPTDEFDLDIQLKASMWIATTLTPSVQGCNVTTSEGDPSGGPSADCLSGHGSGGSVNMKMF